MVYNYVLSEFCRTDIDLGERFFKIFPLKKDANTYTILLHGNAKENRVNRVLELIELMREKDYAANAEVRSILIEFYARNNDMTTAIGIFHSEKRDPPLGMMKSLLNGFARLGRVEEAKEIFRKIESVGYLPTLDIYNVLMNCMKDAGHPEEVLKCFDVLKNRISMLNEDSYNIVFDSCGRLGNIAAAGVIFNSIPPTLLTENIFKSYMEMLLHNGYHDDALHVFFEQMPQRGVRPNSDTIQALVGTLLNANMNLEAKRVYNTVDLFHKQSLSGEAVRSNLLHAFA